MGSDGLDRLLVESNDVAGRVPEPRGDLGRVHADGLHDFASVGDYGVDGPCDAVDHDVEEEARLRRRRPAERWISTAGISM